MLCQLYAEQKKVCSELTRGMLLAGGTSSSLSFAMDAFNRDFLVAGGQFYTPFTLLLGQEPQEPLNRRLGVCC